MNELVGFASIGILIAIQLVAFAYGYGKVNQKVNDISHQLNDLSHKFNSVESRVGRLEGRK